MAVIPDFDESRPCPACTHTQISMAYVEKRQVLDLDKREFTSLGLIQKTCDRCGFAWPEKPEFLST